VFCAFLLLTLLGWLLFAFLLATAFLFEDVDVWFAG